MANRPIKHYLLPVAFMGIFAVHGLDQVVGFIKEPEVRENRDKKKPPKLKISHLDAFPRQFESYYNDVFNWREILVSIGSRFKYYALQESPQPDKVLLGKDGWLFKSGVARDLFTGHLHFGPKRIERFLEEFRRRREIIESLGGKYYLAFPPIKHSIYPEYMPDDLSRNRPPSATEILASALKQDTSLNFIDLTLPLLAAKTATEGLIYHKTDHHWTDIGALIATQEIIKKMQEDFPQIEQVDTSLWGLFFEDTPGWSLAGIIGIENDVVEHVPMYKPVKPTKAKDTASTHSPPEGFKEDYIIAKKTGKKDKPDIFVMRDSFGSPVIKFLSEQFDYSFFLWDKWEHNLNEDIFEAEECDIYVQLIWEGLLLRLIETPPKGWYF